MYPVAKSTVVIVEFCEQKSSKFGLSVTFMSPSTNLNSVCTQLRTDDVLLPILCSYSYDAFSMPRDAVEVTAKWDKTATVSRNYEEGLSTGRHHCFCRDFHLF